LRFRASQNRWSAEGGFATVCAKEGAPSAVTSTEVLLAAQIELLTLGVRRLFEMATHLKLFGGEVTGATGVTAWAQVDGFASRISTAATCGLLFDRPLRQKP